MSSLTPRTFEKILREKLDERFSKWEEEFTKRLKAEIRAELTSGDVGVSKLFSTILMEELRKELTTGDPAVRELLNVLIKERLDVALSTRASESTLSAVKFRTDNIDVKLSTRASEPTLSSFSAKIPATIRLDPAGRIRIDIESDTVGLAKEVTLSRTQVESAPGVFSQRVDERYWGGVALAGRDVSADLSKLDVALSTRLSEEGFTARVREELTSGSSAIKEPLGPTSVRDEIVGLDEIRHVLSGLVFTAKDLSVRGKLIVDGEINVHGVLKIEGTLIVNDGGVVKVW